MSVVPSTSTINHAAFDRLVMSELPEVAAELDTEDRALLHVEMAAVARATSRAIEAGETPTITRHFALMEKVLSSAASDVENAVHVSYLENIFLGEERAAFLAARRNLPPLLERGLIELEQHFENLARHAKDT